MPNFELPFPLSGLNDNIAQSKQPSGTTGEAVNVRGQDPVTGRIRGAQRSGLTKFLASSMPDRLKRLELLKYDNAFVDYSVLANPNQKWFLDATQTNGIVDAVVDQQENLYVIDSDSKVHKINKMGAIVYSFAPQIENKLLKLKSIAVDGAQNIWIATGHRDARSIADSPSELANTEILAKSKIWRYEETGTNTVPEFVYSYVTNLTVERLKLNASNLYAFANDPIKKTSYVVNFENIYSSGMTEANRYELSYPVVDGDLGDDGNIYWTAPFCKSRWDGSAAAYPGFRSKLVKWTPNNLTDSTLLWAWWSADSVIGYQNDEELLIWDDKTGKGRDWFKYTNTVIYLGKTYGPLKGPKYKNVEFGGSPALEFSANPSTETALYSQYVCNSATDSGTSIAPIPTIDNQPVTIFMVVKPSNQSKIMDLLGGVRIVANTNNATRTIVAPPSTVSTYSPYRIRSGGVFAPRFDTPWSSSKVGTSYLRFLFSYDPLEAEDPLAFGVQYNLVRHNGAARSPVETPLKTPLVAAVPAGSGLDPAVKSNESDQNAYIIALTFTFNGKTESELLDYVMQDDGVNVFDSIRINGFPQDRWLAQTQKSQLHQQASQFYIHGLGNRASYSNGGALRFIGQGSPAENFETDPYTAFDGLIAEMLVVKHSNQSFLPRYPRTIGIASKAPEETFTRVSGSLYSTTLNETELQLAWPTQLPAPAYQELIGVRVSRTGSGNIPYGSGNVIKTSGADAKYYQVAAVLPIPSTSDFILALNSTEDPGPGPFILNPAECLSVAVESNPSSITDCERIEGYLAWKYGIWHNLPRGNYSPPTLSASSTYDPGNYPHPFRNSPPNLNGLNSGVLESSLVKPTSIAASMKAGTGEYNWVVTGADSASGGGVGWAIKYVNGFVYTYGPPQFADYIGCKCKTISVASGGSNYLVGAEIVIDGGVYKTQTKARVTAISLGGAVAQLELVTAGEYQDPLTSTVTTTLSNNVSSGTGLTVICTWDTGDQLAWGDSLCLGQKFEYDSKTQTLNSKWTNGFAFGSNTVPTHTINPKISHDVFDNVYYPIQNDVASVSGWCALANDDSVTPIGLISVATDSNITIAQAEKISPNYSIGNQPGDDFPLDPDPANPTTYPRAENVFVGAGVNTNSFTLANYLCVEQQYNLNNPSPSQQLILGVSDGNIIKITPSNYSLPSSLESLPVPHLNSASSYVASAVMFGNVYFTDGISYVYYDPRKDAVLSWQANDASVLPKDCRLLVNWRGRAVLARGTDNPYNWHMSEQGNPLGWNIFPPVQTATQAISGNSARAGLCPDLVNSLVPYNDDLLLFGCDSSLWMMRGDPMAGGVFDLVSDSIGMSFGRSWAKDPEGTLYFFGSRGGVYMMKPGGIPVSMTQSTIERRLTEVNLSQFYVEMFWNTYDDGLHLLLMPFTDTATQTKHYFWERKANAWYEDRFHVTKQPSAAVIIDGDAADDRCLLIGTYDASVVKWDKNATSDDGKIVESKVVIGPVAPDDSEFDSRITNLAAVMAKQGAVNYKLYASTTPDNRGEPVASGQFVPGRNPIHLVRARGAFVWVELQQANAYTRWSLESMRLDAFPAGRKRNA